MKNLFENTLGTILLSIMFTTINVILGILYWKLTSY